MKNPRSILKTPPPNFFTAWSYSRWRDHSHPEQGCPRYAALKHLYKIDEGPKSPALLRGGIIDTEASTYIAAKGKPKLPESLKKFAKKFAELRANKAKTQIKWGLTVAWQPIDFFDWARCWCRVVLDAAYKPKPTVGRVIDFKTGKVYTDNQDQLELYALSDFAYFPGIKVAETKLWYLDHGKETGENYPRSVLPKLQRKWKEKVIPLLTDKKFIPRPGPKCNWCAYSQKRNGPCEF